jgi:hypothetical protein
MPEAEQNFAAGRSIEIKNRELNKEKIWKRKFYF